MQRKQLECIRFYVIMGGFSLPADGEIYEEAIRPDTNGAPKSRS